MAEKKVVTAYTDGACLGNPGPGGFGVVLLFNDHRKELSGGFAPTTNNRMELLAVIEALSTLKEPCRVDLYTDSKYVRDAIEKGWLAGWQRKGWMTAGKKPVKNQDLWTRLSPLLEKHEVRFHWVPGHSGVPENERCDALASAAARGAGLPADAGYPA